MEPTPELLTDEAAPPPAAAGGSCPRCDEPWPRLPAVATLLIEDRPLRRCARCGTRAGDGPAGWALVFTCAGCGVPFADPQLLPHADQRCANCRSGLPPDLPDDDLAAAIGVEVRAALAAAWEFVGSRAASEYLDRVARQIARRIDDLPPEPRVLLFRDHAVRSLALPRGLVLLSTGALQSVADEAELAFVLGHELAHAASGDAAVRLVRCGLRSLVRGTRRDGADAAWVEATLDLMRLGYGRHRERDADERSIVALVGLGYDAEAPSRYLARIERRVAEGDADVAELSVSHPTPGYRTRRLGRALYGRDLPAVGRTNREPFRRAVGHAVLARDLVRVDPLAGVAEASENRYPTALWIALGVVLLALLVLAAGWAFSA